MSCRVSQIEPLAIDVQVVPSELPAESFVGAFSIE
jgi:hypothetical protein